MRAFLVAVVVLGPVATAGAGAPKIEWADRKEGGKLVEKGEAVAIRELRERREKAKNPWKDCWAWVAYEGFRPLRQPAKDAPPSGAEPLPFLQRVNRLYYWQDDGGYFLIAKGEIGTAEFQLLGWVPTVYVVKDNRALEDGATTLLQKALIVNSAGFVKVAKDVDPPPMLKAPDANAANNAGPTFRLFNIYFVYGDSNPRDEENGYLLLGSRTQFNYANALTEPDEPGQAIHGWVDKRRICRWQTREALMWDTDPARNTPVVTYTDEPEAIKASKKQPAKTVTSEVLRDGKPPPWSHMRMRYPVVTLGKGVDGHEQLELNVSNNTLRKIGQVGDFVNDKGESVDQDDLDSLRLQLATLEKEVKNLEILFVVDDSESMDLWFPKTAETIQELIDKVKDDDRTLKIALTYFSDIPLGKDRDDPEKLKKAVITSGPLADANSKTVRQLLAELPGHKTRPGYDPREQVFLGLRRGIEDAGFSHFARKVVILIGDTGDHDTNEDGKFTGEKEIVKRLTPAKQTPTEFYALQVSRPDETDERAFKDQAEKIANLFRAATRDRKRERPAGYYQLASKDQLRKVILDRFTELRKQARETEDLIHKVRLGQLELIDQLDPEFIKALDFPKDKLDRLKRSKGKQLFSYAYVWENNVKGQRQVRRQLLLNQRELKGVHGMLGKYFGNADADERPVPQRLKDFVADQQAGQDEFGRAGCLADAAPAVVAGAPKNHSFETLLKVKFGFHFTSPLLRMTGDELAVADAKYQKYLSLGLKKRYMLLDDVLNKKRFQYDASGLKRVAAIKEIEHGEHNRSFTLHDNDQSALWYWLDYDEEWP